MQDINGIKNNIKLQFGFGSKNGNGGDGGKIILISEKVNIDGEISAKGGDGLRGGKGGEVIIGSPKANIKGKINTDGGKSIKI